MKKWFGGLLLFPLALALCLALAVPVRAAELPAEAAEESAVSSEEELVSLAEDDAAEQTEDSPSGAGKESQQSEDNGSKKDSGGSTAASSEKKNSSEKKTEQSESKSEQKSSQKQKNSSAAKQKSDQSAASEEEESEFPPAGADGVCGERLSWTLKNHVLTISGQGEMYDYVGSEDGSSGELPPWSSLLGEDEVGIQSVVVEEGVTSIGAFAFFLELDLTEVSLPSTLKTIGTSAFGWSGLTSLAPPEGLTSIGEGAFLLCSSLKEVTLPDSVTEIGADAFSCCDKLTDLTLGEGLETIGAGAFEDCPKLKTAELPESVVSIGQRAFGYYTDDTSDEFESARVEGFTLSGTLGSAAQTYARSNLFLFRAGGKTIWPLDTPTLRGVTLSGGKATLRWKAVSGATWYRVYRKTGSSGWTALGETTSLSYTDSEGGEDSVYMVRCLSGQGGSLLSDYDHSGVSASEALTLRAVRNAAGIRLRWNAVSGAERYEIYRSAGDGYTLLATVTEPGYLDSYEKTTGRAYSYRVRACAGEKTLAVSQVRTVRWSAR